MESKVHKAFQARRELRDPRVRKAIPDHRARRANRDPKATLVKKARREKLDRLVLQDPSDFLGQAHHRQECRSSH
jgi:hypothetical protein